MAWQFDNSYARLPDRFYHRQNPFKAPNPKILKINTDLARALGLSADDITAQIATGAAVPTGATPLAQAYAGHQFGRFVPQLGDGRSLLLGEQITPDGARIDIQLKGSGRTPFSRQGDGKAWIGPVLREYVMSEAMAALGLPTTRALAMARTGEPVAREHVLPGAVLMRSAASHIRVGTFEYFAARGDKDALQQLADHVRARHYPNAKTPSDLLLAVVTAQANLIAGWMSVGFIHGVMNTDNCAISGESIDYGPCAFMEIYTPNRVFSSIDHGGRYAYENQPAMAQWNLAQFASCLVPLMENEDAAVEEFTQIINEFSPLYWAAWRARFAAKIGITDSTPQDHSLITDLLGHFARNTVDFTRGFWSLGGDDCPASPDWRNRWQTRLAGRDPKPAMAAHNPSFVPRLHQIETAIAAALADDMAPFETLLAAATTPFADRAADDPMTQVAPAGQEITQTFCGT